MTDDTYNDVETHPDDPELVEQMIRRVESGESPDKVLEGMRDHILRLSTSDRNQLLSKYSTRDRDLKPQHIQQIQTSIERNPDLREDQWGDRANSDLNFQIAPDVVYAIVHDMLGIAIRSGAAWWV